jgi:hypothetical protein
MNGSVLDIKSYAIKIDVHSSKIMHYSKSKNNKTLIEIDNIEGNVNC